MVEMGRAEDFLAAGGEMGRRIRAFDWSTTPLGPVEGWPRTLRDAVRLLLNNRFPMFVWWGPALINLYNDAYIPVLGARHPGSLGRPASEVWGEIWDVIGPQTDAVMSEGRATWNEERLLVMERNGFVEETYFTWSYSPLADDEGRVGGVFCTCTEETQRVLGRRRLRTLRELASRTTGEPRSAEDACRSAAEALASNPDDLPFALVYLLGSDGRSAALAGCTGLEAGSVLAPARIAIEEGSADGASGGWPLAQVAAAGRPEVIDDLAGRIGQIPGPASGAEPPTSAVVLPVRGPGQDRLAGFLVAGISRRRPLDDDYQGFLGLLAGQVGAAISAARAYEEERRRAESLAELDGAKTTFFSNVSHEFRTPLTLMLGQVREVLDETEGGLSALDRERLEVAHRNAIRLQKLVNALLDFSRIEAGRVRAACEPVDLSALTADLAANFRSACERAGIRLEVDCPPLSGPVQVDREMWEKIVLNLVSNAFKFTLEGTIRVVLRESIDTVELSVIDTGAGIPTDQMPHLFERFHRVEGARGRTQEGSGIGLALVRELARLHGGDVRAESQPGRGSTFVVTIPRGVSSRPDSRTFTEGTHTSTATSADSFIDEALRWLPLGDDPTDVDRVGAVPELVAGPEELRPRILLADDNADMRDYLRHLLDRHYEVRAVADGLAALQAAREEPPDLILADVMMPGLDGFGLLRELRADDRTRELTVLLLSARAGEEARVEGLEAGADDYLTKPIGARELRVRVASQLERVRLRRRAEQERRRGDERARAILESITDAFFALDGDWRFTYVNRQAQRLLDRRPDQLLGRSIWEEYAGLVGTEFERVYRGVAHRQTPMSLTSYYADHDRWYEVHVYPAVEGITVYFRDASERIRTAEERERLVRDLREADRRKDEFLAMLGHELRNPLAPIQNAVHILKMAGTPSETLAEVRDMIDRQVHHLSRLVDDLLDVSRIMRGIVELRTESLDLASVVDRAIETARPFIDAQRHKLSLRMPAGKVGIQGDRVRLAQVLANLLNNAAKYTPPGGRIELEARRENAEIVVTVRDNGSGIAPEMLPKVFDLFVQADRTLDRSQGGLGIGLTLVKRLVALHGGRVGVRSDGIGRGAEFTVHLPAPETVTPGVGPGLADASTGSENAQMSLRVVVVDDNDDNARSLAMLLGLMGHDVRIASDGPSALAEVETHRPHLVLLDIGLPGMDGYEVAARLRDRDGPGATVVVAMTGYGQPEDRRRTERAGFDGHLVKPVDPALLGEWLERVASGASK